MKNTKTRRKKLGRPRRGDIERCQTAYWAWTVREMLGLDFSKIERKLNPGCATKREDGGGYAQPQLWRKYGAGTVSPVGNGRSGNTKRTAVVLAEECAPGSSRIYHAALWSLLRNRKISSRAAKLLCESLDTQVTEFLWARAPHAKSLMAAVIDLNADALNELVKIHHLDVMAVLLVYMKLVRWNSHFVTSDCARIWLQKMVDCDQAFGRIEARLMLILVDYEPRLKKPIPLLETEPVIIPKTRRSFAFLVDLLRN